MKNELTVEQTRQMIMTIPDAIVAAEPYLTEIDNIIGDGDHGIGMRIGFQAVRGILPGEICSTVNEVFSKTGMIMLEAMGGASGVIFGTMFISGAIEMAGSVLLTTRLLADMFHSSLDKIKARGKARVGDKTMLDSFEPAVLSLLDSADKDLGLGEALFLAWQAAADGVERSREYVAKKGRAQAYEERAIGIPDPGAVSVRVIFEAMKNYMEVVS